MAMFFAEGDSFLRRMGENIGGIIFVLSEKRYKAIRYSTLITEYSFYDNKLQTKKVSF